jgi:hypothetical protein
MCSINDAKTPAHNPIWYRNRRQYSNNRDHDQQFDQGKSADTSHVMILSAIRFEYLHKTGSMINTLSDNLGFPQKNNLIGI